MNDLEIRTQNCCSLCKRNLELINDTGLMKGEAIVIRPDINVSGIITGYHIEVYKTSGESPHDWPIQGEVSERSPMAYEKLKEMQKKEIHPEEVMTEEGELNPKLKEVLFATTLGVIRNRAPVEFSHEAICKLSKAKMKISGPGFESITQYTQEEIVKLKLEWILACIEFHNMSMTVEDYYYQMFIDNDKVRPIP